MPSTTITDPLTTSIGTASWPKTFPVRPDDALGAKARSSNGLSGERWRLEPEPGEPRGGAVRRGPSPDVALRLATRGRRNGSWRGQMVTIGDDGEPVVEATIAASWRGPPSTAGYTRLG